MSFDLQHPFDRSTRSRPSGFRLDHPFARPRRDRGTLREQMARAAEERDEARLLEAEVLNRDRMTRALEGR